MIAELTTYPAYKPSGIEWLGEVPAHWEARRLGQVGKLLKGRGGSKEDEVDQGVPCVRYGDLYTTHNWVIAESRSCVSRERAREYTPIRYGDLLFAASGETADEIGKSAVNLMRSRACCGGDIILFRPRVRLDPRFVGYAADCRAAAAQKARMGRGFTVVHIYPHQIKRIALAIPPLPEQTAIARFLDHATNRIACYIRAKKKLIALLEEQKQVLVHDAVTGRIDVRTGKPYAEYKPSGVKWLGDMPAHWRVRRLKSLVARIDQGVSPQAENRLCDGDAWGVLKAGCVNGGVFKQNEHKRLGPDFAFDPTLEVANGDILVSRASGSPHYVGSVGCVSSLKYKLILSDKTFRLVFKHELNADFMVLAMNSRYYREQVGRAISGAEGLASNLPLSSLRAFFLIVPPTHEQNDIVLKLREATSRLNAAVKRTKQEISLLHEYRARLIADVVTGKLDVREVAARLPEPNPAAAKDGRETVQPKPNPRLSDKTSGKEANP